MCSTPKWILHGSRSTRLAPSLPYSSPRSERVQGLRLAKEHEARKVLLRWLILLRNRSQKCARIQHLFTRAGQEPSDPTEYDEHNSFQLQ